MEDIGSAHPSVRRSDNEVGGATLKAICYSTNQKFDQAPCSSRSSTGEAPAKKARTETASTTPKPSIVHQEEIERESQQIEREAIALVDTATSPISLPSPPSTVNQQQQQPSSSESSHTFVSSQPSEALCDVQFIEEVHNSPPHSSENPFLANKQKNQQPDDSAGSSNALSHSPNFESNPTRLQTLSVNVVGLFGPLAASSPNQVSKFPSFNSQALFGEDKDGFVNALVHARFCNSANCSKDPTCNIMKSVIAHIFSCKGFSSNSSCPSCKQVLNSIRIHAKDCSQLNCHVPNCSELRKKLLQHTRPKTRVPNLQSGTRRRITPPTSTLDITQSQAQNQPALNAADTSHEVASSPLPSLEVVSSSSNIIEKPTEIPGPSGAVKASTAAVESNMIWWL